MNVSVRNNELHTRMIDKMLEVGTMVNSIVIATSLDSRRWLVVPTSWYTIVSYVQVAKRIRTCMSILIDVTNIIRVLQNDRNIPQNDGNLYVKLYTFH